MNAEALEDLILRCLDGAATADEVAALNEALRTDPAAADLYVRVAGTDALLQGLSEEQGDAAQIRRPPRRPSLRRLGAPAASAARPLAVAAALLVAVALVLLLSRGTGPGRVPAPADAGAGAPDAVAARPDEEPVTPAPAETGPAPRTPDVRRPEPAPESAVTEPALPNSPDAPPPTAPAPRPPAPEAPPRPQPPSGAPEPRTAPSPVTRPVVATIERIRGRVLLLDGADTKPAGEGRKVLEEQGLRVSDKDGLAAVTCPDGTRLELGGRTVVRFAAAPGGDRLVRLDAGTLTVDVARQPAGRRRIFLTPHARAEVLGTRLALSVEDDTTTLDVEAGRVRLVRLADDAAVEVGAGHAATAGPGDPPVARPVPAVTGFTLVDADTDRDIGPLRDGAVLDLARLPTKNLNIRAETRPGKVGCVRFVLDDGTVDRIEKGTTGPLYSLAGDLHGDYKGWTPAPGRHVLTATPYASPEGRGHAGRAATLAFTVVGNR